MRVRRVNVLAFQRKTKMGDGPQFRQPDQNHVQCMNAGGSAPPFIHADPMSMEKEAQKRFEHYCLQEEKLEHELFSVRRLKRACQAMLDSFNETEEKAVPSRTNYKPSPDPY
jgi:hypothetical protein